MIRILSVASEAYPLVKTGGLADVVGALPDALKPHGIAVTTFAAALSRTVPAATKQADVIHQYANLVGHPARLLKSEISGHPLLILDAPPLFARAGGLYADTGGTRSWKRRCGGCRPGTRAAADLASGAITGYLSSACP